MCLLQSGVKLLKPNLSENQAENEALPESFNRIDRTPDMVFKAVFAFV